MSPSVISDGCGPHPGRHGVSTKAKNGAKKGSGSFIPQPGRLLIMEPENISVCAKRGQRTLVFALRVPVAGRSDNGAEVVSVASLDQGLSKTGSETLSPTESLGLVADPSGAVNDASVEVAGPSGGGNYPSVEVRDPSGPGRPLGRSACCASLSPKPRPVFRSWLRCA